MAATTSFWAIQPPAADHPPSFKVADAMSAEARLHSNQLCDRGMPRIVGNSDALRRVLAMAQVVAPTDATVLINGETGTGKELIAEVIHKCSDRSNGPFVKVNCAAIPAGLLESELFGHERGAFTGAIARNIGRFERANGGTLFLDEIGDLPLELQPKLLRVMQERQFERVGGTATIRADVRVICATHRNLIEMVNEGQFRADLFYRLSVFPIKLPSLRERPEDIASLVHHFVMDCAARMGKKITMIAEEFMEVLAQHSWPGNVRELQNFIERSVILSEGGVLTGSSPNPARIAHEAPKEPTPTTLEQVERSHILKVLEETEGVVGGRNGAAARLGMRRTTLIYRLRRMGIHLGQSSTSPMSAAESSLSVSKELGADTLPLSETSDETAGSNFTEARCRAKRVCTLAEAEREHISEVVEMKNGLIAGKGGAAEVLGVPPSTLRNRMKKLGIEFSGPASLNAAG